MRLTEQLRDYINAAFTGLWVQTQEADEAEREILQMARDRKWVAVWDVAQGPVTGARERADGASGTAGRPASDFRAADPTGRRSCSCTIPPLPDQPEVIQTTFARLVAGKGSGPSSSSWPSCRCRSNSKAVRRPGARGSRREQLRHIGEQINDDPRTTRWLRTGTRSSTPPPA